MWGGAWALALLVLLGGHSASALRLGTPAAVAALAPPAPPLPLAPREPREPVPATGGQIATRVINFLANAAATRNDTQAQQRATKALAIQMQALQVHQNARWRSLVGQCTSAVTSARQHLAAWTTRERAQTRLLMQRLMADRDLRGSLERLNATQAWIRDVLRSLGDTDRSVSKWSDDMGPWLAAGHRAGE